MDKKDQYRIGQMGSGVKVGDIVKPLRKAQLYEHGWGMSWLDSMDAAIGQNCEVTGLHPSSGCLLKQPDSDEGWFPWFVLALVKSAPKGGSCSRTEQELAFEHGLRECNFKIGDYAKVLCAAESNENGWQDSWTEEMSDMIGKTLRVANVSPTSGVLLECDGIPLHFPWFVLEKVPAPHPYDITMAGPHGPRTYSLTSVQAADFLALAGNLLHRHGRDRNITIAHAAVGDDVFDDLMERLDNYAL